ncbi:RHS repeat domain-containing protein [Fangia hongkongensis]|uniref:RHS repeat domain-containing protein n=1 Tax=Fangia hongkongensis TaxID=270495 RepID=UPI0003637AD9|nr:RHS repeat-associated core domain-containing protein [Fangia hongkongensis]MBK2124434.1 hypothetical protein [Fangia hongkongensis]
MNVKKTLSLITSACLCVSSLYAGVYDAHYQYDDVNRLNNHANETQSAVYSYTLQGKTATAEFTIDGKNYPITYQYDALQRLTGLVDAEGNTAAFYYDLQGRLYKANYNGITIVENHYNTKGQLTSRDYPQSSLQEKYGYDALGRVNAQSVYSSTENKMIMRLAYQYNKLNSIVKIIRKSDVSLTSQLEELYAYDDMNRLINYTCSGAGCPQVFDGVISGQSYEYNDMGSIKTLTTSYQSSIAPTTVSYQYDVNYPDRLKRYTDNLGIHTLLYDASGNMITDQAGNTLSYTPLGQLKTLTNENAQSTQYLYNALGELSVVNTGSEKQKLIYSDLGLLHSDKDGELSSYIYDGYSQIANKTSDGDIRYSFDDIMANILSVVSEDSRLLAMFSYTPYGEKTLLSGDETANANIGFHGEFTDESSSLQPLGRGTRIYNPKLGAFQRPDTLSPFLEGGINGYAFANGNPVMFADPSGHVAISDMTENGNTREYIKKTREQEKIMATSGIAQTSTMVAMSVLFGATTLASAGVGLVTGLVASAGIAGSAVLGGVLIADDVKAFKGDARSLSNDQYNSMSILLNFVSTLPDMAANIGLTLAGKKGAKELTERATSKMADNAMDAKGMTSLTSGVGHSFHIADSRVPVSKASIIKTELITKTKSGINGIKGAPKSFSNAVASRASSVRTSFESFLKEYSTLLD